MGSERPRHPWRDSAVVVMALTALVFLVGYFRQMAYFRDLGIPDTELPFPVQYYMVHSTVVLFWTGLLFGAITAWDLGRQKKSEESSRELFHRLSPAAIALLAAILYAEAALLSVGESSPSVGWGAFEISAYDVLISMVMASLLGWVIWAQTRKESRWNMFFGRSRPATVVLSSLAVAVLLFGAQLQGDNAADRIRWTCDDFRAIQFESDSGPVQANETYVLLLHANDQFYVRDVDWSGDDRQYYTIQDDVNTFVYQHDAIHDC